MTPTLLTLRTYFGSKRTQISRHSAPSSKTISGLHARSKSHWNPGHMPEYSSIRSKMASKLPAGSFCLHDGQLRLRLKSLGCIACERVLQSLSLKTTCIATLPTIQCEQNGLSWTMYPGSDFRTAGKS